jgi:hypothetical protein
MLTVTDAARDRLSRKLEFKKAAEPMALRLTRTERGWGLRPDTARPDDTTFAHQGKNVLLVDDAVSEAMSDATLEVRTTKAGPRLRLRRSPKQGG